MNTAKITFIGGGNMARSMVGGLVKQGYNPKHLWVSDPNEDLLAALADDFGIETTHNNNQAVADANMIVLAVKPQVIKSVCQSLALPKDALVVSIAAGITCASLKSWLGEQQHIVRAMPNTPALVQTGATGLYAADDVTGSERDQAEQLLQAVGICVWVHQETLIDVVTAVSGSGPAYFFLFLEAMVNAAEAQGLDAAIAQQLAVQTALGAARLAETSHVDLAELRRRVTSPGGTTERAISTFEQHHLRATVDAAMQACADRARQLAEELGRD